VTGAFGYHPGYHPGYHSDGQGTRTYRHESYGQVVKSAFSAACFGVLLVIFAFPVLYYNEKREVHMQKVFALARQIVHTDVPSEKVDKQLEGCLVHMKGETQTTETLRDSDFQVSASNCAKLKREASMYQWVENTSTEERDAPGGGKDTITTYTYSKEWKSEPINSQGFQEASHDNPPMPLQGASYVAGTVSFGAFTLSKSLLGQMRKWEPLSSKDELPPSQAVGGKSFRLEGDRYTTEQGTPEIGDMRVTFTKVPCGVATVLSLQKGDSFEPLTYAMVDGLRQGGDRTKPGLAEPLLGVPAPPPTGPCGCTPSKSSTFSS